MGFLAKFMDTHSNGGTTYNKFTLLSSDSSSDATIADFIVEESINSGTNWSWRKWNSGVAECWKEWYSGSFAPNTSVGGFYGRVLTDGMNLPDGLFSSAPVGSFNVTSWGTGYFWGNLRNVTKDDFALTVFRNDNTASIGRGSLYFIGRWK
jgi:hypothetical protein